MSPEALKNRQLVCKSKMRYPTKKAAKKAGRIVSDKHSVQLRAYKCEFCVGFHLTTMRGKW